MLEKETDSFVQRIASLNDQQAFKRLFWHYYDELLYFSQSMVKNREVAEEIVEDVFVNIWNNRRELPEVQNLKVYLYVSVKNRSINYIQRSKTHHIEEVEALRVPLTSIQPNPEEYLLTSELRQIFARAIDHLPAKCRLVYKMVKEDGLRYKEVATILEISPRTVENHIAKALRKIAENVNFCFEEKIKTN